MKKLFCLFVLLLVSGCSNPNEGYLPEGRPTNNDSIDTILEYRRLCAKERDFVPVDPNAFTSTGVNSSKRYTLNAEIVRLDKLLEKKRKLLSNN